MRVETHSPPPQLCELGGEEMDEPCEEHSSIGVISGGAPRLRTVVRHNGFEITIGKKLQHFILNLL